MKNVLVFLTLTLAMLLAACHKASPKESANGITIGFATEITSFDPFGNMTADARSISFNIFDGLVNIDTDGSFIPAIAASYDMSPDAKTYTFALRKGVRFHDGREVNAEDVCYSLQKAITTPLPGFDKVESFTIDEDGNVVLRLSVADTGFIARLTSPIVPKNEKDLARHPVGTGPYRLTEYAEHSHITLSRNPSYWGNAGKLETVTIKFLSSEAEMLSKFNAGSIDGFSANAYTVEQIKQDKVNKYWHNSNSVQILALNNDFEPFRNADVRRAVNYLVDADEIIQTANHGYGVKVGSALIPALSKYYDNSLVGSYARNVAKAKELLQKSGYANGFALSITVPSVYTIHVQTAKIIATQLSAGNIKVTVKQVDWPTWLEAVYKDRQYEATVISLDGAMAYPTSYLSRYVSDARNNFINYVSPAYDAVYRHAISTTDENERIAAFKHAQRILNEECASVFIQDISMLTVYNKHYAGHKEYPLYASDFTAIYRTEE